MAAQSELDSNKWYLWTYLTGPLIDLHGASCRRRTSSFSALIDTAGNQLTVLSTVVSYTWNEKHS